MEMAEEIYLLETRILPGSEKGLKEDGANIHRQNRHELNLKRYTQLKASVDYNSINFLVSAKSFGEQLIQELKPKKMLVQFGVAKEGDKRCLRLVLGRENYNVMDLDESVVLMSDVQLDLSGHYIKSNGENEFLKNLSRICGDKLLHQIVYETLKRNQHTLLFAVLN